MSKPSRIDRRFAALKKEGRAGLVTFIMAGDPDFGLIAAFGAAPIDSEAFRDELRRLLDTHQPELVLIESFYNFHPKDVEAANLFSRGQVIDGHHKFVRSECIGATSIMTDHYRSTGGKSLDLDNISMAGQAENADSWITRIHRNNANVADGEFALQTGFGSRQWGGTEWNIDWHLGKFDHDAGQHVGVERANHFLHPLPGEAREIEDLHRVAGAQGLSAQREQTVGRLEEVGVQVPVLVIRGRPVPAEVFALARHGDLPGRRIDEGDLHRAR